MFGTVTQEEAKNGHAPPLAEDARVVPARQPGAGQEDGAQHPYRVTIPRAREAPRPRNFFEKYPRNWTWESWAKRMEYESLMVARSIQGVTWAAVGGLLGLAAAGIPGAVVDGYMFGTWQPLGAAIGAGAGAFLSGRRWRSIFESHDQLK